MDSDNFISGGYVISAVCVCVEYLLLGLLHRRHDHELGLQIHAQHRMLLGSFFVKLFFIAVEVSLAIAFGVTEYKGSYNISAIFEWVVALVYIFCKSSFLTSTVVIATDHKANTDLSQMCGHMRLISYQSITGCGPGARSCQKLAKAATKWS